MSQNLIHRYESSGWAAVQGKRNRSVDANDNSVISINTDRIALSQLFDKSCNMPLGMRIARSGGRELPIQRFPPLN